MPAGVMLKVMLEMRTTKCGGIIYVKLTAHIRSRWSVDQQRRAAADLTSKIHLVDHASNVQFWMDRYWLSIMIT